MIFIVITKIIRISGIVRISVTFGITRIYWDFWDFGIIGIMFNSVGCSVGARLKFSNSAIMNYWCSILGPNSDDVENWTIKIGQTMTTMVELDNLNVNRKQHFESLVTRVRIRECLYIQDS